MWFHKSPEEVAKLWLEETIAPYGGKILGDDVDPYIVIGSLMLTTSTLSFERQPLCLEGYRASFDTDLSGEVLPAYDRLLACFYTSINDAGCTYSWCNRNGLGSCVRHTTAARIRTYLKYRRGLSWTTS